MAHRVQTFHAVWEIYEETLDLAATRRALDTLTGSDKQSRRAAG